jgi:hypothetical protein
MKGGSARGTSSPQPGVNMRTRQEHIRETRSPPVRGTGAEARRPSTPSRAYKNPTYDSSSEEGSPSKGRSGANGGAKPLVEVQDGESARAKHFPARSLVADLYNATETLISNMSAVEEQQAREMRQLRGQAAEVLCLLKKHEEQMKNWKLEEEQRLQALAVWQKKFDEEQRKGQSRLLQLADAKHKFEKELAAERERCDRLKGALKDCSAKLTLSHGSEDELIHQVRELQTALADEKVKGQQVIDAEKLRHRTELKTHSERLNHEKDQLVARARNEGLEEGLRNRRQLSASLEQKPKQLGNPKEEAPKKGKQTVQDEAKGPSLQQRLAETEAELQASEKRLKEALQFSGFAETELANLKQRLAGASDASRFANRTTLCTTMSKVTKAIWSCSRSLLQNEAGKGSMGRAEGAEVRESNLIQAMLSEVLFDGFEAESFSSPGSNCLYGSEERCSRYEKAYRDFAESPVTKSAEFLRFASQKNELLNEKVRGARSKEFETRWADAIREVYALHLLALAFSVPPILIRRQPSDPLDTVFCEPVAACSREDGSFRAVIAFMVYPGMCMLDEVVSGLKCQVYLQPAAQQTGVSGGSITQRSTRRVGSATSKGW